MNKYRDEGTNPGGDYPSGANKRTHVIRAGRQFKLLHLQLVNHRIFLDIGCALGWSVHCADFMNLEAYGVEPSEIDREWTWNNLGFNTYEKLEDLPRRDFDLIFMSHVLEHIIDPVSYLRTLRKEYMPRNKARIMIEVPSQNAGSAWSSFHAVAFNIKSLQSALDQAGFQVEKSIWTRDTPGLMWAVGLIP